MRTYQVSEFDWERLRGATDDLIIHFDFDRDVARVSDMSRDTPEDSNGCFLLSTISVIRGTDRWPWIIQLPDA